MNDIDPTKMTDAERLAYFASLTKDLVPPVTKRRTLSDQVAPWIAGVMADRARGLDWKQLADVLTNQLKIKISPLSLQRLVSAATKSSTSASTTKKRRRKSKAGPALNAGPTQGSPAA